MKLKCSALLLLGACAVAATAFENRPQVKGLVVHEWGTFTSFQAADGVPRSWRPLVTSALPNFVYNWYHPGLDRVNYNMLFTKGTITALQRMETPVVYFYSDKPLVADLSVQFPKGLITEWYPQAAEVGPSFIPADTNGSLIASKTAVGATTNSLIHWANIEVMPPKSGTAKYSLPTGTGGNHYVAARETDANILHLNSLSSSNAQAQYEKFLFYRGTGDFPTPLRVSMASDDEVTLSNNGDEPLVHLFLTDIRGQGGSFVYLARLAPGETKTVHRPVPGDFLPSAKLTGKLADKMSQALVKEGLFPREAVAMVTTWKDSWFTENGTRVFYVLPRTWTDRTLPMTLNPAPRKLVRVMVGRAELLTLGDEQKLVDQIQKYRQGDSAAAAGIQELIRGFGRFGEPALRHVLAKTKFPQSEQFRMFGLLYAKNP